jgi:pimeloyl-ACP methyl ester carboxylesterase
MGRADVGGVGIEYEVAGAGRPVILLHGFPDSGRLWRYQVPALADAGFQVVVPDLRGYGRSDKPEAVESYSLLVMTADILAVLTELGIGRAHVVSHDWGASLAWTLATLSPGHVDHLVALSVGHPATFRRTMQQCQKSWVFGLFQFPGIAERWLTGGVWSTGDFALTEQQMTDSAENVTGPWRYERLDGPGHWLQLEAPDQVNALLLDFLPR